MVCEEIIYHYTGIILQDFIVELFSLLCFLARNDSFTAYCPFRAVMTHEASGFTLHSAAFVSTVEKLASDAQKEKWLPLMKSFRVVGTYAQTEIGHGKLRVCV